MKLSTNQTIASCLKRMQLSYLERHDADEHAYVMFFDHGRGVIISVLDEGKVVLVQSLPLVDLRILDATVRSRVMVDLMDRNDELMFGNYVGSAKVKLEHSIAVFDGEVAPSQFGTILQAVVAEIQEFDDWFAEIISDAKEDTGYELPSPNFDAVIRRMRGNGPSRN